MCRIAQHTIGNYPHCQNIHSQIDGGDFALSSSPRLITIYTSCKRGQNRGCDTMPHNNWVPVKLTINILSGNIFVAPWKMEEWAQDGIRRPKVSTLLNYQLIF